MDAKTILRMSIFALTLSAACAAIALFYFREKLGENLHWADKVNVQRETRLNSSIFDIARSHGLVRMKQGSRGELYLESPSCEALMLRDPRDIFEDQDGAVGSQNLKDFETALRLLCASPQGEEIRNEIDAWNAAFDLLAIRDNRFQTEVCESGRTGLTAEIFVPRDCKPNTWGVERSLPMGLVPSGWISKAEPPQDEFAMIADPDARYAFQGDWAMLKSAVSERGQRPRYRMSDRIVLSPKQTVTIDVVGRMRSLTIYPATGARPSKPPVHTVEPANPETPEKGITLGPVRALIFLHCGDEFEGEEVASDEDDEDESDEEECVTEPTYDSGRAMAYQVTLSLAAQAAAPGRAAAAQEFPVVVEIEAEPVQIMPAALRKNRSDEKEPFHFRLTQHIEATCPPDVRSREKACEVSWLRIPGIERGKTPPFKIVLESMPDNNLVDPKTGIIQSKGFEDGLAPIIGLGPQDWGSLVFGLSRRPLSDAPALSDPPALRLTIDPQIQSVAREAVENAARGEGCAQARKDKKGRTQKKRPTGCLFLRAEQTATLVVLDADKAPGEIKAMMSWPPFARHMHIWDLQALEGVGQGPAPVAWRRVLADQRPGSTFKVITAMTAIDVTTGAPSASSQDRQKQLLALLNGQPRVKDQVDFLGLAVAHWEGKKCTIVSRTPSEANALPVPGPDRPRWCAHNFRGYGAKGYTPYWQAKSTKATQCANASGSTEQFGMCEALMVSSNLFFGGVSQQIARLDQGRVGPLRLETIARRLSFDDEMCLDRSGQTRIDKSGKPRMCPFDLLRHTEGLDASKLTAHPIKLDLPNSAAADRDVQGLVRTGWGDGAGATPLAMATVYASLALEKLVRPTLVPLARDGTGCPRQPEQGECGELLENWGRATALFRNLRAGLHAVGGVQGGSAYRAFGERAFVNPDGTPRLFVKTGTATYRAVHKTTEKVATYFSLWLAGWIEGAKDTPIPHRLAFACLITRGKNNETGGGTCAKVVRNFLDRLNTAKARP